MSLATRHGAVRMRSRAVTVAAVVLPVLMAGLVFSAVGIGRVQSQSMTPTLAAGDLVVYDRVLEPARGDIVLFSDVGRWSGRPDALLVKRVVGVGGDRVACCEVATGRLLVNGAPLDEPYEAAPRPGGVIPFSITVPDGTVWVMGDNRAVSRDSRVAVSARGRGGVDLDAVVGVVRLALP